MVFFWSLYNIVPPLMFIVYSTCDGKTPGFERFVGICCVGSYVVAAGGSGLGLGPGRLLQRQERWELRVVDACRPVCAAPHPAHWTDRAHPCCAGGIIAMWLVPSEYDFGKILDTALLFYDSQRWGPARARSREQGPACFASPAVACGSQSFCSGHTAGEEAVLITLLSAVPAARRRSGAITNLNNAVPWRGDSHLGDQYNGSSLLGGWYDDGGTIKMTYSVATSVMMLAWGLQEFKAVSGGTWAWLQPCEQPALQRRLASAVVAAP